MSAERSFLSVDDAVAAVLASAPDPMPAETIALEQADGRTLAQDLAALRTQPPFPASAMDGYAVRASDTVSPDAMLDVIGESAAGRRFEGVLQPCTAVRIFTGAPVPDGADAIALQENATVSADRVCFSEAAVAGRFMRPAGLDFHTNEVLLRAGTLLGARAIGLAASMGYAALPVRKRPLVAILANGDELVMPGETPGDDQIVASNSYALAALARRAGADTLDLGIAPDRLDAIETAIARAVAAGADILVTLGGASVGDHDLIGRALTNAGMTLGFWRVAMRPGRPLMHGRIGNVRVLGLPGNPVSSVVCGILFVRPLIQRLLARQTTDPTEAAKLGADLPANDGRQDYLRATLIPTRGLPLVRAAEAQDSSMMRTLHDAQALIVRAPHAPVAKAGDTCRIIRLTDIA